MAAHEPEQLVRRAYAAWNAGGPGALDPFIADTVELDDAPDLPDSDHWQGRAAVLARLAEVAATVGGTSGDLEAFRALGDEVLVTMAWKRDDDAPGEASLGRVFHLVRVTGSRIARITVFLDEAAALDAAGGPK